MSTSLMLFALSGLFASPAADSGPAWLKDYQLAQVQGRSANKPLAVFIGSGEEGWRKLSQEGALGKEITQLLTTNYVCVYIDTSGEAGESLAAAFQISKGPGLVISNRMGELQAFRHEGDLPNQNLEYYLSYYSDPDRVVRSTETNARNRVSYYQDPGQPEGQQNVQPRTFGRGC